FHQTRLRDGVEVTFEIGVYHVGIARLEVSVDFAQGVLAAATRPKTVAHRQKFVFEYRLDDPFHSGLHDAVLDRRDAQGPGFSTGFGYLDTADRTRSVAALLQLLAQFIQVLGGLCGKAFDALAVNTGRPAIAGHLLPGGFERGRAVDLVDETEPFSSFDAVIQRRQHAIRPDCAVDPWPLGPGVRRTLFSQF